MTKLTDGTQNFWSQLRNYLLSSALTIAVAFYWYGFKLAITITFFLFLCFLWLLSDIKEKMLRALPSEFQFLPANLADYPLINFTWMQQQSRDLEALGFVNIMDYSTVQKSGFARCFSHPEQYCYAEISEIFKPTGESYSRQVVMMSDLEDNWQLGTINREVSIKDSLPYGLWRNPKTVRTYHPNLPLEDLLQAHLQMRQKMLGDLGVTLKTDTSWENYVKKEQEGTIYRKNSLKNKILLLAMLEVTQFEKYPKSEWLGDYAKYATKT